MWQGFYLQTLDTSAMYKLGTRRAQLETQAFGTIPTVQLNTGVKELPGTFIKGVWRG